MNRLRPVSTLAALVTLSVPCFAAGPAAETPAPSSPSAPTAAEPPGTQDRPKVCVDAQGDSLTGEFANRLRERIAASDALSLASGTDACTLQLHVPGNLLRFQTETGIMVSTVVVVTSASGRYLSTSITACMANELKPCAVRAIAVAKLALLSTG